ncbi:THUMP domain-containing protein [Geoalkalibacter halelectricus]|uniref:THUMP domain-containing protein n=1 Tax=Geoalkalibacter halelectricus TaxID=2847045 RepID=A0ABY5ZLK6_9BACT|nr:THUMP domain-containing protein [Geoalkalibacter halelectricus]MDO3377788.1 THUMP domain-containing protein [Geoalkalibacter halelectricus]UWZ78619.1 THUMP domain-containing protein [Geoalkalibacter halelectricus]
MWKFNIVATMAGAGRYRHMLEDLAPFGEFRRTEFLGVALGQVSDPLSMLETIRRERERKFYAFQDLGRIIPVERVFTFTPDTFGDLLKEMVPGFLERLAGKSFYVRLERRGHKGEIISPEIERDLDAFILAQLEARGAPGTIDFTHPEAILAVETLGDRCGLGLLTRDLMERYEVVRVG